MISENKPDHLNQYILLIFTEPIMSLGSIIARIPIRKVVFE